MRASIIATALVVLAPPAASPSMASTDAMAPVTAPAQLAGSVQFDLRSKKTGRNYRIYISKPRGAPPPEGFPVLYTLDGDLSFGIARAEMSLAPLEDRAPTIVVGIGYAEGNPWVLRTADMTPSMPAGKNLAEVEKEQGPVNPASYGEAEKFYRFMTEELRPVLIRHFAAAPKNQALMGYSLGGLYALHVLFRHPETFQSYVIGSPSIWWNEREILKGEAAFGALVRAGKVAPRILITSGEWEQSEAAPNLPASNPARAKALIEMRESAMVDNARGLATRLQTLKGNRGYLVRYAQFPEETHLTGIAAATSRGVTFVSGK